MVTSDDYRTIVIGRFTIRWLTLRSWLRASLHDDALIISWPRKAKR